MEYEAHCAASFIAEKLGGRVDVLYGISLGGMVGNEILLDKRVKVHTFIADGYTIMPMPTFRSRLIRDLYIKGYSALIYSVLTKHRQFLAKVLGRTKESIEGLLYTKVGKESIRNSVESEIGYRYKFESFNMTDSYIFHGSAEMSAARKVHGLKAQGIRFHHKIFPETGHAELIHKDPKVLLYYIGRAYRGGKTKC